KEGTTTDREGAFSLPVKSVPVTLSVNYLGYKSLEIDIYEKPTEGIIIYLVEDVNYLNEVVVTGYVQQKRGVVTASLYRLNSDEIEDVQSSSFDQQLQGKIPGVTVSTNAGVPGTSVSLLIRGATSIKAGNNPLYVVDGVFINQTSMQQIANTGQVVNSLADLNPNDIESIDVLKDANATSIYGSRGSNGVIIITTKRGKFNNKTSVSAGVSLGWSKVKKLWDLVDGPEYAELENELYLNEGGDPATLPYPDPLSVPTYTQEKLDNLFRVAPQQNYFLNVSGGDAKTTFYIGLDYNHQLGVNRPDDFARYSGRINLDHKIAEKFKIGTSIGLSRVNRRIAVAGNATRAPIPSALNIPPNVPSYNPDGTPLAWGTHDAYLAMIYDLDDTSQSNRLIGSVYGEWNIVKNLTFRTNWNVDYNLYDEDTYYPTTTATAKTINGRATSVRTKRETLINEQTLRYNFSVNQAHSFSFLVGNTIQKNNFSSRSAGGSGFPSDDFKEISYASTPTSGGSSSESGLISVFGRIAYDYKNKYIADVNIRSDGSSKFGANNKWGSFPSAGVAWSIGQEDWFTTKWVDELKIRSSYGLTGNQGNIGSYDSYGLWRGGANYDNESGIQPSQLANPDLRWETTSQFNVGVDAGLFDNRLRLEFNYYNKYTKNLLVDIRIKAISGFANVTKNGGELSNKGFEFALNSVNVRKGSFTWATSFNISHNENKIIKLESTSDTQYFNVRLEEGYSMFNFYGYKQLGVNPDNGDIILDDPNGNGRIDTEDQQFLGSALPVFSGGLDNTFTYKGFDLNISLPFTYGNHVLNRIHHLIGHGGKSSPQWGYTKKQLERWQKPGDITDMPKLQKTGTNYAYFVSRFIEDGSYIKIKTITLGYNIPKSLLSRFSISGARIFVEGSNLFTFTNYTGVDPEINIEGRDGYNVLGVDFVTAPIPRTFLFGFNLKF
ncbi:MAG: TonB-dependent receptor, partial [Dysgonamonadaceae bacterium]|nr:TonB-dependent receptor [Dysgonamonadaceae bacterium]